MKNNNNIIVQSLKKYITPVNIVVGISSLIIIGLAKELGLAQYILALFNIEYSEFRSYIISGFIGLVWRLGLKGLIEEAFKDWSFSDKLYMNTGNNPFEGGTSQTSGLETKGSGSSGNNSKDSTSNQQHSNSERNYNIYKKQADFIHGKIKDLMVDLNNCNDEAQIKKITNDILEYQEQLQMLDEVSCHELKKTTPSGDGSKRNYDTYKEASSSKRRG